MTQKQGLRKISDVKAIPFRGGAYTAREKALVPHGQFSMIQNMRARHPGFEQRKGSRKKHTIEEGTNQPISLYQFSKGKRVERHFFAQFENGNVDEATDAPPTVTTGPFGSGVFAGSSTDQIPASWGNIDDLLIYSNGVDQHQIYAGTANYVLKFIKYDASAAPPSIPSDGYDYTKEVTDGLTTTVAILDSLNTYSNYECLFICTPISANRLTWTFKTGRANATAAVGTLSYMKSNNSWTDTGETDGTIATSGKTLGQDGSMTWNQPSDEIPCYMFGVSGFWYRWETATQIDGEVEVSSLTYGTDGKTKDHFVPLVNVWDGKPEWALEARVFDQSNDIYGTANHPRNLPVNVKLTKYRSVVLQQQGITGYEIYSTDSIDISSFVGSADDSGDRVYFNSFYPIDAFYVDPGDLPSTTASTTINKVFHWTGAAFTEIASITDETDGITHAGWVTLNKTAAERTDAERTQFQNAKYYSYWYYFTVDTTLSSNVLISLELMPYYDIADFGIGLCNAVWKNRAVYTFDRFPNYAYISADGRPTVLNGDDFGILRAGDGRANKITCMKPYYNELLAWQSEKGKEGGTLTLFQGINPQTFDVVKLSSTIGTFNAKSAVVVDDILDNFRPQEGIEQKPKTLAFWISKKGVYCTDGLGVFRISHDIQNYFDPRESECIANGYDNEHWIEYDSSENVLRLGIVSGSTATTPNIFLVYDLEDKKWLFDDPDQTITCMTEVEAASGQIPILQYAGGLIYNADDEISRGFIYQVNYSDDDVDTAIDGYLLMELDQAGLLMVIREMLLRMKVQSAGDVTITPYRNTRAGDTITLDMTAATTNDAIRKQRIGLNLQDEHVSLKIQNATLSQSIYLLDLGLEIYVRDER